MPKEPNGGRAKQIPEQQPVAVICDPPSDEIVCGASRVQLGARLNQRPSLSDGRPLFSRTVAVLVH